MDFFWRIFLGDLIKISLQNVRPNKKREHFILYYSRVEQKKMCNAMIFVGCLFLPMVDERECFDYSSENMCGWMGWKRNSFCLISFEYRY